MKKLLLLLTVATSLSLHAQTDKLFELLKDNKATMAEITAAIDKGADLNAAYTAEYGWMYGMSPVHIAAAWQNLPVFKLLEQRGADIYKKIELERPDGEWWSEQHHDCNALHVATFYWDDSVAVPFMDYLMAKGFDPNALCYGGQTPLMYTLLGRYSNVKTIRYLVEHGADVKKLRGDATDGESVLYYCTTREKDRSEEAAYLISKGASANMSDNYDDWDLLASCIYFNDNKIGKLLVENRLFQASGIDYMGLPDENDKRRNVNNHLHFAVLCGNYRMVKTLLDAGLSPESTIQDGATAFDLAREKGDASMLNLLKTKTIPSNLAKWYQLVEGNQYPAVDFNVQQKEKPFEAETSDGIIITNSAFKGKVVLLNIWATWCGFCIKEMPDINVLATHFPTDKFKVLAVSVDNQEDKPKFEEFVRDHSYKFTYVFDPDQKNFYDYSSAIPCTWLIGKDGRVMAKVDGAIKWSDEKYITLIQTLIDL